MKFPNLAITASIAACSILALGQCGGDKMKHTELDDDKLIDGLLSGWMPKGGGNAGDKCEHTSDCLIPNGLDHGVCRDGQCQSGSSGSLCGVTSDCVVQNDLDPPHPVCRHGKCQHGVVKDYCGQDSDCISGLECHGGTNIAKCQRPIDCPDCY